MTSRASKVIACAIVWIVSSMPLATAQQYSPGLFGEMRWRSIGPFRAGRTKAGVGIASQPNVFYIGVHNGGVWKTTDYAGRGMHSVALQAVTTISGCGSIQTTRTPSC